MPASYAQPAASAPYHHGDLRMELLRVCREQLRSGGLNAISLRKAAPVIGVSHASPARHFADKRALLTALAAQGFAEAAQALHSTHPDPDCRDDLQAMCERYVAFGLREPDLYALMAQPKLIDLSDPALAGPRNACFLALMAAVAGSLDGAADDLEGRTVALWSFLHGFVMLTESGVFGHDHAGTAATPCLAALLPHVRSGICRTPSR
ncbi:MAG: TetR/AcrR family transcriptional regulator [Rhodobacter sp.]|nr:TetR/AcrR family transcriptional regulator [Rhodobacter sp.]